MNRDEPSTARAEHLTSTTERIRRHNPFRDYHRASVQGRIPPPPAARIPPMGRKLLFATSTGILSSNPALASFQAKDGHQQSVRWPPFTAIGSCEIQPGLTPKHFILPYSRDAVRPPYRLQFRFAPRYCLMNVLTGLCSNGTNYAFRPFWGSIQDRLLSKSNPQLPTRRHYMWDYE